MLQNTKELYGAKLAALDGEVGRIKDFYFEDRTGAVRYLIAETGSWLTGRLVLLLPHAVAKFDQYENILHLKLTKIQIENSPSLESHRPAGHRGHSFHADLHLQSAQGLTGYAIQTIDGAIGRVSGLRVDDRSWLIRELVVETGHWHAGKQILITTLKIERISDEESKVFVNLTKADVQQIMENGAAPAGRSNQGMENLIG